MKTLVIGASHKPERYSNIAMNLLRKYAHETVALGRKERKFNDWHILEGQPTLENIDTITLYLNPGNQKDYYQYIKNLQPRRVIFNPGTENEAFENDLEKAGIETERACTLVLLNTGQY